MVKKGILCIFTLVVISGIYAQDMKPSDLYRPVENAAIEIDKK